MIHEIFSLAWPTMLEELLQATVGYIDTAMVGSLGTEATAAVGATGTVSWLFGAIVSAIGIGFLSYIARMRGSRNYEKAKLASSQALSVSVILGIALTLIMVPLSLKIPDWMQVEETIRPLSEAYLMIVFAPTLFRCLSIILGSVMRANGDSKTPLRVSATVNAINIALNYILIYGTHEVGPLRVFGAGLGVRGAAMASAISFAYGGIAITMRLLHQNAILKERSAFKPKAEILTPCFAVAFPVMIQKMAVSSGYVVFASMINALGEASTAAHTIANTVESAFYIPGWGMQAAAATLAGNACGANDEKRLRKLTGSIILLEVGFMMFSGAMLFIFATPLVSIFSKDPEVISLGSTVLKMVAFSEPFYGIPIVLEGIMQGMGKTKIPFAFNVAGMWAIRIFGTFITTHVLGFGLVSAWAMMIAHNISLFLMFSIYFKFGSWGIGKETSKA